MSFLKLRRFDSFACILTPITQISFSTRRLQDVLLMQHPSQKRTFCRSKPLYASYCRHFHTSLISKDVIENKVKGAHVQRRTEICAEHSDSSTIIHSCDEGKESELDEFNKMFDTVCKDLLNEDNCAISEAVNWESKVLRYNVKNGKKNRGLAVVKAYKILAQSTVSHDFLKLANILGWCVEMLQAFFLVCDDVMDQASMRRGEPCWYRKPDVGLCAINDSLLLQCSIYKILKKYFSNSECYMNILHEFLQVTRKTVFGQCLDMLSTPPNRKPRFENFTLERYNTIVEHKTSHYTYCLPVHLAMHLVGNFTPADFQVTKHLCLKLGLLFQIQDDYLDCFGDPKLTGKLGNDISQGKCTWFIVKSLEQARNDTKESIVENYGVANLESVAKVLEIYKQLSLKEQFKDYENNLYSEITTLTSQLPACNPSRELFSFLLQKAYKRQY